jgi:anti-sigma factor RsiW
MNDRPSQALPVQAEPQQSTRPTTKPRRTLVLHILPTSAVVSGAASWLSLAAGSNVPAAVLTGGGAFAGTVGLLLAVAHYTAGNR